MLPYGQAAHAPDYAKWLWRPAVKFSRWSLQEALHWGHQREQVNDGQTRSHGLETGENK